MLESRDLVVFVVATDLRRARAFYEQTLGLPVLEQDDFACVLDAHGTTLRVTAVPEVIRAGYGAGDIIHGVSVQSPLEPLRPSTPKTS